MSTQPSKAASTGPQLLEPNQARAMLFQNVWANAFFDKLAEYGIVPQSQADEEEMLKLAGELSMIEQHPTVKAAAAPSLISQARNDLHRLMASQGIDIGGLMQTDEKSAWHKAAAIAGNPDIYNAALSLKLAEAAATVQQQQGGAAA